VELSEAIFRGLVEAAPDAMVGVDGEGRIALINAQAERLFGYARQELVGREIEILVPEGVRHTHLATRAGYLADPKPRPMGAGRELSARRKDGTQFPVEISLSAIDTPGGVLVSAAVRDVTDRIEAQAERERLRAQAERERMEAQLHQSQRLESLGQLAGGIAHDFNNLLAVILNYSAFVTEELNTVMQEDPGRWSPVCDDVAQIQRAAERATELTHQLLAFGRREVVRPVVLNLNGVVTGVEQLLHRTLGEHVDLVALLADDLWRVKADPGQIEQVLVNLAVNARDAMPTGGALTIDTDNVHADEGYAATWPSLQPGRYVRLRVNDTGSGMSEEVISRAFEPFFTTKAKGDGSGLGLATVYGIVTQAGGHVEIYSAAGMGTTVKLLLPATDDEPDAPSHVAAAHHESGGETVLVVEDEEAMREVTKRILIRHGYTVITACDGVDALRIAQEPGVHFDMLVTDVVMPKMLGKELAGKIKELCPGVAVLFMSGYAQPVLASQGTLDEGVHLVEKPFTAQDLLARVREVLDVEV
jgi:PAS domain S-box-containing protein